MCAFKISINIECTDHITRIVDQLLVCQLMISRVIVCISLLGQAEAWTLDYNKRPKVVSQRCEIDGVDRRRALASLGSSLSLICSNSMATIMLPTPARAYTPDPDKLQESLYFISRVQEATVQQERFVSKAETQEDLQKKMKLTLRLVEKNYRLLDQINYCSSFVEPEDKIVVATEAGYEAADSLQEAIDFVKNGLGTGPLTDKQRIFLMTSMQDTRENLFVFLKYMPQNKLKNARLRVEDENVKNRDEFSGDEDAGVYNPVVLPWKQASKLY